MTIKLIGATLVILSCGAFGLILAAYVRREVNYFRELIGILDFMECELSCRLTSLPKLCRLSSEQGKGFASFFSFLAESLENQVSPDPASCMEVVLHDYKGPSSITKYLHELGCSFGKFDLQGQISGLISIRQRCIKELTKLESIQEIKAKNYCTISFCAGMLMTILLL